MFYREAEKLIAPKRHGWAEIVIILIYSIKYIKPCRPNIHNKANIYKR